MAGSGGRDGGPKAIMQMALQYQQDSETLQLLRTKITNQLQLLEKKSEMRRWEDERVKELRKEAKEKQRRASALKQQDIQAMCTHSISRCENLIHSMRMSSRRELELDRELKEQQDRYVRAVSVLSSRWQQHEQRRVERRMKDFEQATIALRKNNQAAVDYAKARERWEEQLRVRRAEYQQEISARYQMENEMMARRLLDGIRDEQLRNQALKLAHENHTNRRRFLAQAHAERSEMLLEEQKRGFGQGQNVPQKLKHQHHQIPSDESKSYIQSLQNQAMMMGMRGAQSEPSTIIRKQPPQNNGKNNQQQTSLLRRPYIPAAGSEYRVPLEKDKAHWERLGDTVTAQARGIMTTDGDPNKSSSFHHHQRRSQSAAPKIIMSSSSEAVGDDRDLLFQQQQQQQQGRSSRRSGGRSAVDMKHRTFQAAYHKSQGENQVAMHKESSGQEEEIQVDYPNDNGKENNVVYGNNNSAVPIKIESPRIVKSLDGTPHQILSPSPLQKEGGRTDGGPSANNPLNNRSPHLTKQTRQPGSSVRFDEGQNTVEGINNGHTAKPPIDDVYSQLASANGDESLDLVSPENSPTSRTNTFEELPEAKSSSTSKEKQQPQIFMRRNDFKMKQKKEKALEQSYYHGQDTNVLRGRRDDDDDDNDDAKEDDINENAAAAAPPRIDSFTTHKTLLSETNIGFDREEGKNDHPATTETTSSLSPSSKKLPKVHNGDPSFSFNPGAEILQEEEEENTMQHGSASDKASSVASSVDEGGLGFGAGRIGLGGFLGGGATFSRRKQMKAKNMTPPKNGVAATSNSSKPPRYNLGQTGTALRRQESESRLIAHHVFDYNITALHYCVGKYGNNYGL